MKIQTQWLRPGDVVATHDENYRRQGGVKRAIDFLLPLNPTVWRTVSAVEDAGDQFASVKIHFTDGRWESDRRDLIWEVVRDTLPHIVGTRDLWAGDLVQVTRSSRSLGTQRTPGLYRVAPVNSASRLDDDAVFAEVLAVCPAPLGPDNATRGWKEVSTTLGDIVAPAASLWTIYRREA